MLKKFRDQEFALGWLEVLLVAVLVIAFITVAYAMGYRLGNQTGYESAMTSAIATMERMPLAEDFNKNPTIDDVSNIYARLTETEESLPPPEEMVADKEPEDSKKAKEAKKTEAESAADNTVPEHLKVQKGWYVQIAAPHRLKDAEVLVEKLKKSGFAAQIDRIKVGKDEYFRVVSGPETSKVYADRLRDQLEREKLVESAPFVREY